MKDVLYERNLSIKTYKEGQNICIEVQDNGTGIPETIKDKLFQPFFTTKPQGEGTGIGLWSVYNLVKKYGSINIDSEPGRTTVIIKLDSNLLKSKDS
jgi:two-component system, NtrC family, sensor kinase